MFLSWIYMNYTAVQIIEFLRSRGHRITKVRSAMLKILAHNEKPLAVPELIERLKEAGIIVNKTTVYREIEFLQSQNMVKSIYLGEDKKRYELVGEDHHHHLICISCEKVEDVELSNDLTHEEKRIQKEKKFKIQRHSLEFFGLCRKCQ